MKLVLAGLFINKRKISQSDVHTALTSLRIIANIEMMTQVLSSFPLCVNLIIIEETMNVEEGLLKLPILKLLSKSN